MKPPKVLRVTLAVGLSSLLVTGYSVNIASAETKSQLQNRLESVQKKQKNNTNDLNDSKKQLNENSRQQDNLAERIQASQTKIQQLSSGIQAKQKEVAKNQADMSQLKNEIVKITKRIEKRDSLLRGRLRSIYINGGAISYIDVIMGSKSFGNFLDRLLALKTITDQDNNIINAQKKDREAQLANKQLLQVKLEKTKKGLENLVSLKSQLDREQKRQKSMLAQLKVKETEINDTVIGKNEQADILAAQASVIKQQMGDLDREEARKKAEEEKKKADAAAKARAAQTQSDSSSAGSAANNGSKKAVQSSAPRPAQPAQPSTLSASRSTGGFSWPASGRLSSSYGYRSFDNGFHPGIDIANSTGTPILATADGIVFRAYVSPSYGNCAMISHVINGQTYTSVYAHMSQLNVTNGQKVSRGQVIGAMGSTGNSTGSHLHFELYNGPWTPPPHPGTVNPLNYLN